MIKKGLLSHSEVKLLFKSTHQTLDVNSITSTGFGWTNDTDAGLHSYVSQHGGLVTSSVAERFELQT
jgi:hypothetical protein